MRKAQGPISSHHYTLSCAGIPSERSDLWRHLSWCIGDKHAGRICWIIDRYCAWFNLDPARLHWSPK
jgi:hypothetical protein